MMQRLVEWHQEWEREMLAVLRDPALAIAAPPGYRRATAKRLAGLSEVERAQLLRFSLRYQGWRIYAAAAKWLLLCLTMGGVVHLLWPTKLGIVEAMGLASVLGVSMMVGCCAIWFNYRRMPKPSVKAFLIILAMATAGALCGASVATLVDGKPLLETLERTGQKVLLAGLAAGAVYGVLIGGIAIWRNREYEALNAQLQLKAEAERLARQISDTQLQLLRAQIEPHFLFNTLGAVQQLAQAEAPRAAELTAHLIAFLRASLAEMRRDAVTLAEEFSVVEAYLKVMQARLADRLQFTLDLPQALAGVRIPGMLLLTLAENAIKHGIEPALRGGNITITARWARERLTLQVQDTGVGLPPTLHEGMGLANVRERLQLRYGAEAALHLQAAPEGGVVASVDIPLAIAGA